MAGAGSGFERAGLRTLRPGSARRLTCAFLAVALWSCSAGAGLGPGRTPPGVIPVLSLAGRQGSDCAVPLDMRRWGYRFEMAQPVRLEIDPARIARAEAVGGVGRPIVFYFACRRFVTELVELLEKDEAGQDRNAPRAEQMLAVFLAGAPARGALWSLAMAMRVSPDEPFVYGKALPLADDESISVRFDPTQSDARLMLDYRHGL